jgi:CPA1 family monovalent cation:H+ antiporter
VLQTVTEGLPGDTPDASNFVRKVFKVRLTLDADRSVRPEAVVAYGAAYRGALQSARRALLAMRDSGDIGDDAFHTLENELDWMEVADPVRRADEDEAASSGHRQENAAGARARGG